MAENILHLSENWIKAWNDRSLSALSSLMKENSMFGRMQSRFAPIFKHDQALIPELYISERFGSDLKILVKENIVFQIEDIKCGDAYSRIFYKLSTGLYGADYLRIEEGKIDQFYREIDSQPINWI